MPHSYHSRGFTLIELMFVVVILGILAAMCLPLFAAVKDDARRAATEFTVCETQKAIDLYRLQLGRLPELVSDWSALTSATTVDGKNFGPYLMTAPRNQLVSGDLQQSTVLDGSAEVFLDQAAFAYDYQAGQGTGRLMASMRARP